MCECNSHPKFEIKINGKIATEKELIEMIDKHLKDSLSGRGWS